MEATYNYILQSGLCMLLLYSFYMLVLRSFPRTGFSRLYLLLAPVLALLLPLLELSLPFGKQLLPAATLPAFQLPGVVITAYLPEQAAAEPPLLSTAFIVSLVYGLAAVALLARLGMQLFRLRSMLKTAVPVDGSTLGAMVLQTQSNYPSFAFLNYVFINQQADLSEQEQKQILTHELAHVRLGHTYDVLYYELLTAILWFNPVVWLLKSELRDVHEYQADAAVVAVYQPDVYTSLLAKEALYRSGMPVGSYFHKPQVFKRLHMLQKRKERTTILRPLLAIPLLLLLVLFFSTKEVTADMVQALAAPTSKAAPTQPVTTKQPAVPVPATIETENPTIAVSSEPITQARQEPATAERKLIEKPAETKQAAPAEQTTKEKPFEYVEEMPEFEGGELELQKYLAKNLRYPPTTKEAGRTGMVVAGFVVETDGQLSNVTILKGIDEAADAEVKRLLASTSGKWQPGRQNGKVVPVRFTIPVRFALMN